MDNDTIRVCAITTKDNPFDPIDDFDDWYAFDEQKGYHTTAYLDRVMLNSHDLSDRLQDEHTEDAIDEIIRNDYNDMYKKVVKNTKGGGV